MFSGSDLRNAQALHTVDELKVLLPTPLLRQCAGMFLDQNGSRIGQGIRELNSEQFSFIVSNPCIEVWFLNHFRYSTKEFLTNDKVIGELKIHVPNYEKSMNMYPVLASKIDFACTTEEQLERNYEGRNWPSIACNPRSDVIKLILKEKHSILLFLMMAQL